MSLPDNMIRFVQLTAAFVKKAEALQQAQDAKDKAAANLTPGVVDNLIASGVLPASQKAAAMQKLASHAGTLEVLSNAGALVQEVRKSASAQPTSAKSDFGVPTGKGDGRPAKTDEKSMHFPGQKVARSTADDTFFTRIVGA